MYFTKEKNGSTNEGWAKLDPFLFLSGARVFVVDSMMPIQLLSLSILSIQTHRTEAFVVDSMIAIQLLSLSPFCLS